MTTQQMAVHGRALTVRVPGSCGELVQGIVDGVRLHVSCPVDRYARATWRSGASRVQGEKVRRALAAAGASREFGAGLTMRSDLPRGIGMASSTADIGAAVGLWLAMGRGAPDPGAVARAALAVEPTDGVLFDGVVLFDHRRGTVLERWGSPPPIEVVAVEAGGPVDTLAFNERDTAAVSREQAGSILQAFDLVRRGLAQGDAASIGRGATISALCHQNILPKPALEPLLRLALEEGGYGVNVAHSGSLIGLLLPPGGYDRERVARRIAELAPSRAPVRRLRLVGGGIDVGNT
ncbi:MAG: GHMP kinase [Nitrospiria bacterium]